VQKSVIPVQKSVTPNKNIVTFTAKLPHFIVGCSCIVFVFYPVIFNKILTWFRITSFSKNIDGFVQLCFRLIFFCGNFLCILLKGNKMISRSI